MTTPHEFITKLSESIRNMRMHPRTRDQIRERLVAYADMHAGEMPARVSILSPWTHMRLYAVRLAALFIVVGLVSTGVASAAENTLPGDVLYPIKVHVTEPLRSALIQSPSARGQWNATLAERRLDEATALAADHKLTEPTQAFLAAQFTTASDNAAANADTLAASGNVPAALDVRSDLQARLEAHADLLALLATHGKDPQAGQLLTTVETARDAVDSARQKDAALLADATTTLAQADIDAAARATDSVSATANGDQILGTIDSRLTGAQKSLTDARAALAEHKTGGAYVAVSDAARNTREAAILVHNRKLILSLRANASENQTATSTDNGAGSAAVATTTEATTTESITKPENGEQPAAAEQGNDWHRNFSLPSLPSIPNPFFRD